MKSALNQLKRDAAKRDAFQAKLMYAKYLIQTQNGKVEQDKDKIISGYIKEILENCSCENYLAYARYLRASAMQSGLIDISQNTVEEDYQAFIHHCYKKSENIPSYIYYTAPDALDKLKKIYIAKHDHINLEALNKIKFDSYPEKKIQKTKGLSPEFKYKVLRKKYEHKNINSKPYITKLDKLLKHPELTDTLSAKIYYQLLITSLARAKKRMHEQDLENALSYMSKLYDTPNIRQMDKARCVEKAYEKFNANTLLEEKRKLMRQLILGFCQFVLLNDCFINKRTIVRDFLQACRISDLLPEDDPLKTLLHDSKQALEHNPQSIIKQELGSISFRNWLKFKYQRIFNPEKLRFEAALLRINGIAGENACQPIKFQVSFNEVYQNHLKQCIARISSQILQNITGEKALLMKGNSPDIHPKLSFLSNAPLTNAPVGELPYIRAVGYMHNKGNQDNKGKKIETDFTDFQPAVFKSNKIVTDLRPAAGTRYRFDDSRPLDFFVRTSYETTYTYVGVDPEVTVEDLEQSIQEITGRNKNSLSLISGGRRLSEGYTLGYYRDQGHLVKEGTIHCGVKLLGD